jgi:hypothetical protein
MLLPNVLSAFDGGAQTTKKQSSQRSVRERARRRKRVIDSDLRERVGELAWRDCAARRRLVERIDRDGGIGPDPEELRRLRAPESRRFPT